MRIPRNRLRPFCVTSAMRFGPLPLSKNASSPRMKGNRLALDAKNPFGAPKATGPRWKKYTYSVGITTSKWPSWRHPDRVPTDPTYAPQSGPSKAFSACCSPSITLRISSMLYKRPRLHPGQFFEISFQSLGVAIFDSQNGQVRHCEGLDS